jgi:hypothetical protein
MGETLSTRFGAYSLTQIRSYAFSGSSWTPNALVTRETINKALPDLA